MRIPNHIGIIPDGNRRYASSVGLSKDKGYSLGILPGLILFKQCQKLGIKEMTFYGFTVDNTKRPSVQKNAFTDACIESVKLLSKENAELLVIGNKDSKNFPEELLPYTTRKKFGSGGLRVNFLVNYAWEWDLYSLKNSTSTTKNIVSSIQSNDISRIDLIIRWGGRRRLSGFLPVQSVYSDFYILDDLWPDFKETHLFEALNWYNKQDITLGG
ncbi:MAG: undecaprenyl diphosphate synthase family protein [Clostridium sp.]